MIRWLQAAGCQVRAYDPYVKNGHTVEEVDSLAAAAESADCLLVLTDHREFKVLTPATVGHTMRRRVLIDTHNALPHADWQAAGFEVYILGNGRLLSARSEGAPREKYVEEIIG